jgi:hypothetical protein
VRVPQRLTGTSALHGHASWACISALAVAGLVMMAAPAAGLPPNPERANKSRTCAEALERLSEAERGSPLVSEQENEEILKQARAVVAQLCSENNGAPCPTPAAAAPQPLDNVPFGKN